MLEIFNYDFMNRAFIAGTFVALLAPLIGLFLVVRRYSLIADTLAHVSLAGIAMSLLLHTPSLITAMATTIIAAIGIERLRAARRIIPESMLGIFLWGSLAFAVIVFSAKKGLSGNLLNLLFGNITTVSNADIATTAILGLTVCAMVFILFKELFLVSFDEETAAVNGIRVQMVNTVLMALTAIAVTLAMRVVGLLLIGALMIIPVTTAMQWGKSFRTTLFLSLIISLIAVWNGLFLSFYLNIAAGGAIVGLALCLFMVSAAWRHTHA